MEKSGKFDAPAALLPRKEFAYNCTGNWVAPRLGLALKIKYQGSMVCSSGLKLISTNHDMNPLIP
jgi:hypothetical protein